MLLVTSIKRPNILTRWKLLSYTQSSLTNKEVINNWRIKVLLFQKKKHSELSLE